MAERPGSSVSFGSNPMNSQTNLQPEKVVPKNVKKKNFVVRFLHAIWSTKDTRTGEQRSDIIVKTTLKELIIYCVFLAVITTITFAMTSTLNFYFTNVLINLFTTPLTDPAETQSPPINWVSAGFQTDIVQTIQYKTLDAIFGWDKWYNNDSNSNPLIYYENKLLGSPRVRQLRVRNDSCRVNSMFRGEFTACYGDYSASNEDTAPFGLALTAGSTDTAWTFTPSWKLRAPIVSGYVSTYGAGGYYKDIGTDKTTAFNTLIVDMFNNYWLDRGTRAFFIDFTIYNANINMFCGVRLIAECPAAGGVISSYSFRPAKLIRYVTPLDYFVLALEIFYCLFIVYYVIEEVIEIRIHKFKYFLVFWNLLDIAIIIVSIICMCYDLWRTIAVNDSLDSLLANPNQYPEFDTLISGQTSFNNAIAILTFVCWIKFFKHVSFNKTMNQLSETLGRCAKDLVGFGVMFFIVFFAFVQLGYLLFGARIYDYSSISNAMFALFRTILGDFDFAGLQVAAPILGPIYFISYIFFVFFVLVNMFLAIINDTYSGVKGELTTGGVDEHFSNYFKSGYNKLLTKLKLKKEKLVDIQNALESADMDGDKTITFDEWKQALKKKGFSDTEIDAFFSKYDVDGNKTLTAEEQKKMMADLHMEYNKVDNDLDEVKQAQQNKDKELMNLDSTQEEKDKNANTVSLEEFKVITQRVDTMETSIGTIVNRIDIVLSKLESLEKTKLERREAMAKILDKLNEANNCPDPVKRAALQQAVRADLERWEVDTSVSLQQATRAPSAATRELTSMGARQASSLGSRQTTGLGGREASSAGFRQQ